RPTRRSSSREAISYACCRRNSELATRNIGPSYGRQGTARAIGETARLRRGARRVRPGRHRHSITLARPRSRRVGVLALATRRAPANRTGRHSGVLCQREVSREEMARRLLAAVAVAAERRGVGRLACALPSRPEGDAGSRRQHEDRSVRDDPARNGTDVRARDPARRRPCRIPHRTGRRAAAAAGNLEMRDAMRLRIRWTLTCVAIIALLIAPSGAASPALTDAGRQALAAFLRESVAHGDAPAVAAIVVSADRVLFLDSEGKRDVAKNIPMTPDTIFRMASMTKPVTSLAAMMLIEHGKLRLDDPVATYLPEFAKRQVLTTFNADGTFESRPPNRPVTVRDLL